MGFCEVSTTFGHIDTEGMPPGRSFQGKVTGITVLVHGKPQKPYTVTPIRPLWSRTRGNRLKLCILWPEC